VTTVVICVSCPPFFCFIIFISDTSYSAVRRETDVMYPCIEI